MKVESTEKKAAAKECKIVQKEVFIESIATISELDIVILSLDELVDEIKSRY